MSGWRSFGLALIILPVVVIFVTDLGWRAAASALGTLALLVLGALLLVGALP